MADDTTPAPAPAPAPATTPEPTAPRAAEAAVLDEVAGLKKQMADLAAFVGFGRPPPIETPPPDPAPAARKPGPPSWLHPWAAA